MTDRARVADALDLLRFDELARHADLAASFWQSLKLAAERGEAVTVAYHWQQITAVSKAASALVKALGSEEAVP